MSNEILERILADRRSQPQQLIEVLQDVQEAFGYVPQEAMTTVSKELGVPLIEVSRVADQNALKVADTVKRYIETFRIPSRGDVIIR